jgi:hypothetical protein
MVSASNFSFLTEIDQGQYTITTRPHLNDFSDGPLRNLDPASELLVQLLLVPGGQLRQEGGRGIVLVTLLGFVASFGVEPL